MTDGVGGAGEAGVVGAHSGFHAVELSLGDVTRGEVGLGDAVNRLAHGPVVVPGGDDQVDPGDHTGFVGLVMVDERAARGFDDAHAHRLGIVARVEDVVAEDVGVVEQHLHPLGGKERLDQAGVVVVQGVLHRLTAVHGAVAQPFLVGEGRIQFFDYIQAPQRADTVHAFRVTHLLVEGEFQIRPIFHMFTDVIQVILHGEAFQLLASGIYKTDVSFIKFKPIFRGDQTEVTGGEDGELVDVGFVGFGPGAEDLNASLDGLNIAFKVSKDEVAVLLAEGFVDTAGSGKDGMDAPAADDADDLLAPFA